MGNANPASKTRVKQFFGCVHPGCELEVKPVKVYPLKGSPGIRWCCTADHISTNKTNKTITVGE